MNGNELPPEAMEPAPPGTPPARRVAKRIAPVRCLHGVRWSYLGGKGSYVADDAATFEHPGHDIPGRTPGDIPCFDRVWDPERDGEET